MHDPTHKELEQKIRKLETDLAAARRKLRERMAGELKWRWETTFDAVGASICVLATDWTILQCNSATRELFQRPQAEIIGRKCFELVHGTAQPPDNCPLKRLAASRKRETEVLQMGDRWVEIAVDPVLDESGHLRAIVHIITDITEHKQLAASLQQRQITLRSIFEAAPTGIGMVVERRIVQANDRLCQMTGYAPEELVGQSARILYPTDEDFEYVGKEKYRQIFHRGTGTVETRWRRKTGEILEVLLSSSPLDNRDPSAGVTFTALDISERKRTEEEFSRIFNMSLDMLCIADIRTATFTKVNPAFLEVLGYTAEELLGRNFLHMIHPDDLDRTRHQLQAKLKRGERVINFENRYRCKDGSYRWLNWVCHPDRERGLAYTVAHDISTRKKGEAELLAAAQVVKEIPSGLFIYDYFAPDRLVLYQGNPAAEKLTAIRMCDWIGKEFNELWPAARQRGITDAFLEVMRTGRAYHTEDLFYRDDRLQGAFKIAAFPMSGSRLCVAFENITERKQSEAALQMFKSAVEASSDAIGISTPQGRHWFQNKAFDDLFGEIGSDPPATLYVDQGIGREIFRTVIGGRNWSGEVEMYGKSGGKLQILLRAYAVKNGKGEVTSLVGVHTDITERKRFEGELQRSEQRFRALAELLPQTVYEMDMNGRLTFVNNNAFKVFGYAIQDLQDGMLAQDLIAPEDRKRARTNISEILQGKAGYQGRKYTAQRKDGSTFPVLIYSSVSTDASGATGMRGIIIDISEQEELVRERDKLEEQYIQAQKMEAIGRLAGGVAHDLNNMLSPIVGYGELLLDAMPSDAPNREAIEQILGAGLRAKEMVRQLLAFSRKQALEIKSINLNQVLAGFQSLLDRMLRDDIKLELKLARGVPDILADPGQIEQVVMNLAVNAQDAMPGGGKITIEVDAADLGETARQMHQLPAAGQYVVLEFSDTGHGMDANTKERIFDPFFTTKGQGKGTGLGLATVYGIVKQHNGNIRVYSEPGLGTAFKIYFPAAPSSPRQIPGQSSPTMQLSGSESILIVEDNNAVRNLAKNILEKYGYRTTAVSGGRECRDILDREHHFDVLLTDVVLQDANGKELYNLARERCPDIKVLYMSGYTDEVIVHHGVLEEGICFIQKPFSIQDLLKKLRDVLDSGTAQ